MNKDIAYKDIEQLREKTTDEQALILLDEAEEALKQNDILTASNNINYVEAMIKALDSPTMIPDYIIKPCEIEHYKNR